MRVATWPPGGIVGGRTNFGMRPGLKILKTLDEKFIFVTSHSILQLTCVFSSDNSSQLHLPMSEFWSLLLYRNTFQPRNVQVVGDCRLKVKIYRKMRSFFWDWSLIVAYCCHSLDSIHPVVKTSFMWPRLMEMLMSMKLCFCFYWVWWSTTSEIALPEPHSHTL